MNHQQALEVLKKYASTYQSLFPASKQEYAQALTIAIAIMEGRKDEMMLMYEAGWNDAIEPDCSYRDEYHYNSLTKTSAT